MNKEEIERLKAEQPDHKHAFEMKEGGYIKTLEDKYRKAARAKHPDACIEGDCKVLINFPNRTNPRGGSYVQTWVWVDAADLEEVK